MRRDRSERAASLQRQFGGTQTAPGLREALSGFQKAASLNTQYRRQVQIVGDWDDAARAKDVDENGNPVKTGALRSIGIFYTALAGRVLHVGRDRDGQQRERARDVAKLIDLRLEAKGADMTRLRALEGKLGTYLEIRTAIQNLSVSVEAVKTWGGSFGGPGDSMNLDSSVRNLVHDYKRLQTLMDDNPEVAGILPPCPMSTHSPHDLLLDTSAREKVGDEAHGLSKPVMELYVEFTKYSLDNLEHMIWAERLERAEDAGLAEEAQVAAEVLSAYRWNQPHWHVAEPYEAEPAPGLGR